jgi:NADH-quinone oxidoreductase subunit J
VELVGFVILTALAVVSAAVVLLHRNPVVAALSLAANLIAIAGFYLLLNAQFLALLQVIVYAGAIMVLVLFTIMLLNLPDEVRLRARPSAQTVIGLVLAIGFVGMLGWVLARASSSATFGQPGPAFGSVSSIGTALFTSYFYPFEAVSLLLVVAMIGAVLLAKRRI